MDIAYHFNADMIQTQYPDIPYYNLSVLEKLFRSLLTTAFNNLNLKIFEGDLLAYKIDANEFAALVNGISGAEFRTWREINIDQLKSRGAANSSIEFVLDTWL